MCLFFYKRVNKMMFPSLEIVSFALILSVVTPIQGLGFFDVKIIRVENTGGRLADGRCCTGGFDPSSNDSVLCPGICNTALRVCLLPYHDEDWSLIGEKPACNYGENSTEHSVGGNSFQFSENDPNSILSVGFTFNWPGATTLIIQLNHLRLDGSVQLIKRVVQGVELNATATGNWTEFHSQALSQELQPNLTPIVFVFRVRVRCDTFYYGPYCNIKCIPHDGVRGHYECDENGKKRCKSGWRNLAARCTEPICARGCRGGCDQPEECSKCPLGWTGPKCNRCKPYPGCVNGYCLIPNDCLCKERWGGLQCEDDMDYCFHKSPCLNGATCIPFEPNNYMCKCMPGYFGRDCEFEENPCRSSPCLNFGTCVVKSRFEYVCVCGKMHSGPNCEHLLAGKGDADPCIVDNNSYNHGDAWERPGCRRCRCVDGFANCTRVLCQTGNCLLPGYSCPQGQHCSPLTPDPWSCIRAPCTTRSYGKCYPTNFDESAASERHASCSQSPSSCTQFTLNLNISNLPIGTYANDVCYHLLLFVFELRFSQYNALCTIDPASSSAVRIQVVSLKDQWPVAGFRSILEETLRGNHIGHRSAVLAAITSIQDASATKDKDDSAWPNATHAVIASIATIGFIICLLAAVAYFLWRQMRSPLFRKSDVKPNGDIAAAPQLDVQLNNWTNRGKRCNILAASTCGVVTKSASPKNHHPNASSKRASKRKGEFPDIVISATQTASNRSHKESGSDSPKFNTDESKARPKSTIVTLEATV